MRTILPSPRSLASGFLRTRKLDSAAVVVHSSELGICSIDLVRSAGRAEARRFPGKAQWHLEHALEELDAYFEGRLRRFTVPLDLSDEGTPFQRRVWEILLEIPHGTVRSYAQVAARAGMPRGARAVGGAVGRNPVPVIVPCHRVVGSGGRLTGFGLGLKVKTMLLELEGAVLSRAVCAADSKVLS